VDNQTEIALRDIVDAEMSFYQRAQAVVRLLTLENVSELISRLPDTFRPEFVRYAEEVYAPTVGQHTVIGRPLAEASLTALRVWLQSVQSELVVEKIDAQPISLRFGGGGVARLVEQSTAGQVRWEVAH